MGIIPIIPKLPAKITVNGTICFVQINVAAIVINNGISAVTCAVTLAKSSVTRK